MASVGVTVDPQTVSASATINFVVALSANNFANGDILTIDVPDPGSFTPSSTTSDCSSVSFSHFLIAV